MLIVAIFLEVDASQIEARQQFMFSRDPKLIARAQTRPVDYDLHRESAAAIFKIEEAAVTKPQRYFGKKTNHAAMRGMGGDKMSEELLKEGYAYAPDECQRMIDDWLERFSGIPDYFAHIRTTVLRHRGLVNTWGRIWRCDYDRLDHKLYGKAYSFLPQSECADLMNQWAFLPCWKYLKDHKPWARINIPVHDSLLISCRPADAYDIAAFLRASVERPRVYYNNRMVVPLEYKLGKTWAGDVEFKELPSREEFTEAALKIEREMKEAA